MEESTERLHLGEDTQEATKNLCMEIAELIHKRMHEILPGHPDAHVCLNCVARIGLELVGAMSHRAGEGVKTYGYDEAIDAYGNLANNAQRVCVECRVEDAVAGGQTPDINDVMFLVSQGAAKAEIVSYDELPDEVKAQIQSAQKGPKFDA